jgi:hypothetical protein
MWLQWVGSFVLFLLIFGRGCSLLFWRYCNGVHLNGALWGCWH